MHGYWLALSQNLAFMLLLLPIVGAALVLATSGLGLASIRRTAVTNAVLTLLLALLLVGNYDQSKASDPQSPQPIQMVSSLRWVGEAVEAPAVGAAAGAQNDPAAAEAWRIAGPDIRLAVGVDGVSLWLITLSAVLMLPAVLAGRDADAKNPAAFYALLLLLQASVIGLFAALDVVLFCICLESCSLLLFFLIGIWGGYNRRRVVRKFFVCNLCGSLLILVGFVGIVVAHSWMTTNPSAAHPQLTFSIPRLVQEIPLAVVHDAAAERYWLHASPWIVFALLLGFGIKMPVIPFHTWMPEANVEAPAAVSLLMTGVVLKVGGYGFVRMVLPLFPEMLAGSAGFLLAVAIGGVVFAGLLTLGQDDVKKVVTYAGLVQAGLCAAAILTLNTAGATGGLLQFVSHGLAAGALLFLVGILDRNYRTSDIEAFGGLLRKYPRLAFCLAFAALSLVGMPGLAGFPGEWLSLVGLFQRSAGGVLGALFGSLLVAWAFVWLLQRMLLGRLREPLSETLLPNEGGNGPSAIANAESAQRAGVEPPSAPSIAAGRPAGLPRDLLGRELLAMAPLGAMILCIGLCPQFFVARMEPAMSQILSRYQPAQASAGADEAQTNVFSDEDEAGDDSREIEFAPQAAHAPPPSPTFGDAWELTAPLQ